VRLELCRHLDTIHAAADSTHIGACPEFQQEDRGSVAGRAGERRRGARGVPEGEGPMSPHAITGALAGATFAFRCDAPDLSEYASMHLAPLAMNGLTTTAVSAELRWHEGQPRLERPSDVAGPVEVNRLDRDVYVGGDTLHWFRVDDLRDLHMRFTWRQGRLAVSGDFYHRLGNSRLRDQARRLVAWRQGGALRRRRFTTLLYYLVYYPCWWWLEQTQDLHPVHAAGVLTGDGVILLAGASGVGKSTLAVALAAQPGARLLSDSFVLHSGADVFPVREPVLLDAWSRRWLGRRGDLLRAIDWRYGLNRRGYHVPANRLADSGRAALVVLLRRSTQAYARRVSAEEAHRRLSAADMIINDLRRYWAFAAIMEQMLPSGLVARREAQIASLVAAVPCYEVGLTADMSSTAAVESITRLLEDAPPRVASVRL
jgi:hypothetical protein